MFSILVCLIYKSYIIDITFAIRIKQLITTKKTITKTYLKKKYEYYCIKGIFIT